jgi:hypothetical protein
MKRFRMMSLPLIVGALFLFCGAPGARAATDCDWAMILDNHSITAANIMDLRSIVAAVPNSGLVLLDLPDASKFDTGQLRLTAGGADQVWNLTFLGLSGGIVAATATVGSSTSLPTVAATVSRAVATAEAPTTVETSVPEAPSLLYLGSGLVLCGGFWLRRRRF